jgi:hypothetical protein
MDPATETAEDVVVIDDQDEGAKQEDQFDGTEFAPSIEAPKTEPPRIEGPTAYKVKAFSATSPEPLLKKRRVRLLVEGTVVGIHEDLTKDGWVSTAQIEKDWVKVLKVFNPDPTLFDQEPPPPPAHVIRVEAEPDESGEGKIWKVSCRCGLFEAEAAEEWEADVKGQAHLKEEALLEPPLPPGLEQRIDEHTMECEDCEPGHPCPVVFQMRADAGEEAEPPTRVEESEESEIPEESEGALD